MQYKMEKNFLGGFASRLKSLRDREGKNIVEFAKWLGVSFQTYHHYESGNRKPTLSFLMLVATSCHVSTDELLGLEKQNGEVPSAHLNKAILQKAEAIIDCAEHMKNALAGKITELKRVL